MKKFTAQDVIDLASKLYDNQTLTRSGVRFFLQCLLDTGRAEFDLDRMYDLIVG